MPPAGRGRPRRHLGSAPVPWSRQRQGSGGAAVPRPTGRAHHFLAPLGAVPVEARVVADGKYLTGGGVTAGIDMALTVVRANCSVALPPKRTAQPRIRAGAALRGRPPGDGIPPEVVALVRERAGSRSRARGDPFARITAR